jgi:6-phosphogluconate dehydrogenase
LDSGIFLEKESMQIGYIGLGKMGKNMVLRLLEQGHEVVVWNRSEGPRREVEAAGAVGVGSVEEMVKKLAAPRVVWLMLPAGEVTGKMVEQVSSLLEKGDTMVEGANSFYKDTIARAEGVHARGQYFVDVGVSGGPAGARAGACLMIGGDQERFTQLEPLFRDIAAPNAYRFFSGNGAGHFVKMVHNGIEYGMMQAIAEGFEVLKTAPFALNLEEVAQIYNTRSVIESRLVGWLESGYAKHGQNLGEIASTVAHSGEGEWTIQTAAEFNVPVPVIEASLQFRKDSAALPSYAGKVLSVLRNEFGGHEAKK